VFKELLELVFKEPEVFRVLMAAAVAVEAHRVFKELSEQQVHKEHQVVEVVEVVRQI
jgi:hypothetical protein